MSSISKIPDLNKSDLPIDKLVHLVEYFFLGILMARGLFYQNNIHIKTRYFIYSILIAVAIGFFDESYQFFVPNRDANILDFLSDSAGSILGTFIFNKYLKDEKFYKENFPG
ncbi:VanZ family protein [candidate division KSB1 bacterium]